MPNGSCNPELFTSMKYIYLTPHALYIYANVGDRHPSMRLPAPDHFDDVPRAAARYIPFSEGGHMVPVSYAVRLRPEELPPPRAGVTCICSTLVAAFAARPDILSPGKPVRDSRGRRLGCLGLVGHARMENP